MISNERPSPFGQRSFPSSAHKPNLQEETLKVEKLHIERKTFVFTLKENPRGRFVRITEDVSRRRETIIIPITGLEEFKKAIETMAKAASEIPVKKDVSP